MSNYIRLDDKLENKNEAREQLQAMISETAIQFFGLLAGQVISASSEEKQRGLAGLVSGSQWPSFRGWLKDAKVALIAAHSNSTDSSEITRTHSWFKFVIHHAAIYSAKGNKHLVEHYNTLVEHMQTLEEYHPTMIEGFAAGVNDLTGSVNQDLDDDEVECSGCCGLFNQRRAADDERKSLVKKMHRKYDRVPPVPR